RCLFYMFWKIKKMLVSSTNIKKYRAFLLKTADHARFFFLSMIKYKHIHEKRLINKVETDEKNRNQRKPTFSW
ncbi:hypothetical protein, partial [Enterococcus faecium]|uniref:hypothetical protein n=1 Tax=Enterococcus faecium TaxID=1352 RepID=UPI0022715FDC